MTVGEPGPRASVAPSPCGAVVPEVLGQGPAGVIDGQPINRRDFVRRVGGLAGLGLVSCSRGTRGWMNGAL